MGSTGSKEEEYKIIEQEVTGTPLIFGTAMIRPAHDDVSETVDIDGYSNKKSINAALRDLAKAIAKYNKTEADAILDMIKNNEVAQYPPTKDGGYILTWEEVPGASQWNEETDEMEYADGRWYLHVRFVNS